MIRAVARLPLWWVLMHLAPAHPPEPSAWRIVETPSMHVGVRPAASWGEGVGLTIQVTVRTPW